MKQNIGEKQHYKTNQVLESQDDISAKEYIDQLIHVDKQQLSEIIEDDGEIEGDHNACSRDTGNFGISQAQHTGDENLLNSMQLISSVDQQDIDSANLQGIGIGLTNEPVIVQTNDAVNQTKRSGNSRTRRSRNDIKSNQNESINIIDGSLIHDENH